MDPQFAIDCKLKKLNDNILHFTIQTLSWIDKFKLYRQMARPLFSKHKTQFNVLTLVKNTLTTVFELIHLRLAQIF